MEMHSSLAGIRRFTQFPRSNNEEV